MTSSKRNSRRLAWVVLGLAIPLAVTTVALHWDDVWLWVAYEEGFTFGTLPGEDYNQYLRDFSPIATRITLFRKRVGWLPGPDQLCVFYTQAGCEIDRQDAQAIVKRGIHL